MSDTQRIELLGQSSGYGILVGVGAFFALMIVVSTRLMTRYLHENSRSTEMFMVANRTVGLGLTAAAIYSSWTWPTELLWVCTMVYNYGIMASFWYGAGLSVQICLMSVLGIEAKKKIPACHTSLEIVNLRYGKVTHILFMFFCLVNNLLSCSSMILGAAGAISIIAGNLHPVASTMLIPFGVLLYTTVGGLKATFLTDFVHTLIVLIVMCVLNTSILTSDQIGGLDGLYDKLKQHDNDRYVEGNYEGSFLTGKSQGAIFFGLILTLGNFSLTVMDSSFWQKAFSSDLKASVPGYLLAAGTIFANVWPTGAIAGVASIVLESSPSFPTYPRTMTESEVNSGFVLPFVLKAVLSNSALGALLLLVYLAVTSTVSAQMISVSSIVSFDIYKTYINPKAENKQMIKVSHFGVVFFGLFAAAFSVMLHYVNVNITWMGYFYTILNGPGVLPLVFTITWKKQTRLGATISPVIGVLAALVVWITTANHYYGAVTVDSLGQQLPCLFGAITAVFLPGVLSIIISLTIKPYDFDWKKLVDAQILIRDDTEDTEDAVEAEDENRDSDISNEKIAKENITVTNAQESNDSLQSEKIEANVQHDRIIKLYTKIAYSSFIFVLLLTWVVWPLPLYRDWIWSKPFFKGYVTVGLIWLYLALIIIGLFPLYDGRHALAKVARGTYRDYIKRR